MYQNIDSFYKTNKDILLGFIEGSLRPSKSLVKDVETCFSNFKSYWKAGNMVVSKELVPDIIQRNVDENTKNQNIRVMQEFGFLQTLNGRSYSFTERFVKRCESSQPLGLVVLDALYEISGVDSLTMYLNFLLCTLREAYTYGEVVLFPDSADKFTARVPDKQKRDSYRQRVFNMYGFLGDTRRPQPHLVTDEYTPNMSYMLRAELENLGLLIKGNKKDGLDTLILTANAHHLLQQIDSNLSLESRTEKNQKTSSLSLPPPNQPLQQIFYGAPGTGKSHTINRDTKGRKTFRTTFHPDSDYSTFVGAYKPVMEEVETCVVPVVLNNGAVFDQNKGTLKEKKISYRFVKQAFMKAYIAAWRTFADATLVSPIQTAGVTLTNRSGYDSWILNEANSKGVNYTKESKIAVDRYETLVKNYWEAWTNADDPETFSPGRSDNYPATACVWYKKNHDPHVETSAEACWTAVKEYLGQGNSIEENPKDQLYRVTLDGGEIRIYSTSNARLETIEEWYNNGANGTKDNVQKNIAIRMLGYELPTFEEAWEKLKGEIDGASQTLAPTQTESVSTVSPVFLIIEEINRGNCAQIFGDLFQLLDRKEGFSQYPIHADEDVRKCLVSEHTDEDPSFGIGGLDFTPEQASYINSVLDCEDDVAEKIARGEVLVLPPNLYIWATMNTSDQSLFPIDSAFKRRWEWKYVKIKNHPEENYQIKLSDTDKRDWWEFVKQVNRIIASMTSSADKQLGYFFCKADGQGIISADKFVSKVLFYLWNDVFKDYGFEDASLFRYADATDPTKTHELTFPDFYDEEGEKVNIERVADFIGKVMAWDDNQKQA